MNEETLKNILGELAQGHCTIDDALGKIHHLPYSDLGDVKVDHWRALRQGLGEVVFGRNKTAQQIAAALQRIAEIHGCALATQVSPENAQAVLEGLPSTVYDERAWTLRVGDFPPPTRGPIGILSAGTSDYKVAAEATATAQYAGIEVRTFADVGVAGIQRLLAHREELNELAVAIVIAGMEGALASVVGGLLACPVIAVPTSVGYGANLGGFATLLGMLAGCASGVTVVNIDNGYGAAIAAHRILRVASTN